MGDANISGNATLLKQFTVLINQAYNKVVGWIIEAQGKWQFDDSNYTDFGEAVTTLVADQYDYTLPGASAVANFSTFLRLIGVYIKDLSGNYIELTEDGFNGENLQEGMPSAYKVVGNSLILNAKPTSTYVTLTQGLLVKIQRIPDQFVSTDTTQQPGLPATYHPTITYLASHAWLITKKVFDLAGEYKKIIYGDSSVPDDKGLKGELQRAYADKNDDVRPTMQARSRRTNYE